MILDTVGPQIPSWTSVTLWIHYFEESLFCLALLHEGFTVTMGSSAETSQYICIPAQFIAENGLCADQYFEPCILKSGF